MRTKLIIVAVTGALAIAFGAMGAHALKEVLNPQDLSSYKTAVNYHIYHALFMLALLALQNKININISFYLALAGLILFSGSIYLLVLDELMGLNLSFLGPVTPLGGLTLIAAWLFLIKGAKNLQVR